MTELQNGLPPGWDCKYDEASGKYYYINHYTRTTSWEDPRNRHLGFAGTPKHLAKVPVEHIPLQHGSPEFKRNYVYPSHSPPIQAFQMNSKTVPLQEMRSITRSPLTLRSAKVQDSSFTTASSHSSSDTDDSVAKISAMFPTVSETHIKLLLKKYLNREALVISALQVEKYPITTPGPFSTPPPQRNIHVGVKGPVSRTGSPNLRGLTGTPVLRSSPRPHSSPKLKLRYMKSIFANADETLILECLQNNDNSIQKTSDLLKEMGYSKKESVKITSPKPEPKIVERGGENMELPKAPSPVPKMKTAEEKEQMKMKLQEQYKDVPEHLISIALESVNFNENRASQILNIMKQEDSETENNNKNKKTEESTSVVDAVPSANQNLAPIPISQSRQSIKSLLKSEKKDETSRFSRIVDQSDESFKSSNLCNTLGHNPGLSRGPNEKLLLENYVQWQGPSKTFQKGPKNIAKGPNKNLLSNKVYTPCGPNAELLKGPRFGLAKGSIFAQLKTVVVGESRVK